MWNPPRARWLTSPEKWHAMGFPILQPVANAYGCRTIDPTRHIKQPHFSIGNSQCVPNTAAVILTALLSVRRLHPQTVGVCCGQFFFHAKFEFHIVKVDGARREH